ncbi:hypothetical protein KUTeg_001649, partial [Tegillarca granosa]
MRINGLVPARFLTIIAHMIIVIVLFWSRDENIKQLIIGLSVALGLFAIELIGFFGGITMFMSFQTTAAHAAASIALVFFLFDYWPCDYYWYIFGFCSAFPGFTEILTMIGVGCFNQ